jgi:hypothetical protein
VPQAWQNFFPAMSSTPHVTQRMQGRYAGGGRKSTVWPIASAPESRMA